jgi:hypothetical protein
MKAKLILTLPALALAVISPSIAQKSSPLTVNQAVRFDVSPPLTEMALLVGPIVPAAGDEEVPLRIVTGLPEHGSDPHRDPLLQRAPLGIQAPPPIENFAGLGQVSGVTPPDTDGDVGLDFIVQWNNLAIAIWDKDNPNAGPIFGPVNGNTIFAGFGGPCETTNNGDPIVFFDHLANRWFLSQFAINSSTECIAISTTSDPMGPYFRYAFVPVAGQSNDYPHCGLWTKSYLCTYRMFPSGTPPFATFTALNRGKMLIGDPTAEQVVFGLPCATNDCPDAVQPVHLQGRPPATDAPALFIKDWDDDFNSTGALPDGYRIWELEVDWANPGAATFVELPRAVSAGDWDQDMCGFFNRACVEQPAPATSANFLDPFDEATMWRAVYRHFDDHDAIVVTHTIDATGGDVGAMRWAELRDTAGWTVFQEGVFSPTTDDRWMGSIAMDGDGNIGLAYSVSSLTVEPSVRYTGRTSSDAAGMMRDERTLIDGTGVNQSLTNRWGDYSVLTIDPEDDCTFWMFQEFMEVTGVSTYSTRIGSFRFPDCQGNPVLFADGFESGDTAVWSNSVE